MQGHIFQPNRGTNTVVVLVLIKYPEIVMPYFDQPSNVDMIMLVSLGGDSTRGSIKQKASLSRDSCGNIQLQNILFKR